VPTALTEIRCLQVDLVDLLLFGNHDGKADGEEDEDDEMNGGRDDIGLSP